MFEMKTNMLSASECDAIFIQSIEDIHAHNDENAPINNPYNSLRFEYLLYMKNWIDTVQWHLEDVIRAPDINPVHVKRRIDKLNQDRTDTVER
jgi:hypothetical protein